MSVRVTRVVPKAEALGVMRVSITARHLNAPEIDPPDGVSLLCRTVDAEVLELPNRDGTMHFIDTGLRNYVDEYEVIVMGENAAERTRFFLEEAFPPEPLDELYFIRMLRYLLGGPLMSDDEEGEDE